MNQPEVPQAAIDAAADAQIRHLYPLGAPGEGEMDTARDEARLMLEAADRHIGAAWLRWAADYLPPTLIQDHNKLWLRKVAARIEAGDD